MAPVFLLLHWECWQWCLSCIHTHRVLVCKVSGLQWIDVSVHSVNEETEMNRRRRRRRWCRRWTLKVSLVTQEEEEEEDFLIFKITLFFYSGFKTIKNYCPLLLKHVSVVCDPGEKQLGVSTGSEHQESTHSVVCRCVSGRSTFFASPIKKIQELGTNSTDNALYRKTAWNWSDKGQNKLTSADCLHFIYKWGQLERRQTGLKDELR